MWSEQVHHDSTGVYIFFVWAHTRTEVAIFSPFQGLLFPCRFVSVVFFLSEVPLVLHTHQLSTFSHIPHYSYFFSWTCDGCVFVCTGICLTFPVVNKWTRISLFMHVQFIIGRKEERLFFSSLFPPVTKEGSERGKCACVSCMCRGMWDAATEHIWLLTDWCSGGFYAKKIPKSVFSTAQRIAGISTNLWQVSRYKFWNSTKNHFIIFCSSFFGD